MIYNLNLLQPGFKFEFEVAGITYWGGRIYKRDEEITLEEAIKEQINSVLRIEGSTDKKVYNPANPSWGLLPILFAEVKSCLKKKRQFTPHTLKQLRLYISIGSKLDFFHHIDLFFTWGEGVFVPIDITLKNKRSKTFLIRRVEVEDNFKALSREIADELVRQFVENKTNPGGDVS